MDYGEVTRDSLTNSLNLSYYEIFSKLQGNLDRVVRSILRQVSAVGSRNRKPLGICERSSMILNGNDREVIRRIEIFWIRTKDFLLMWKKKSCLNSIFKLQYLWTKFKNYFNLKNDSDLMIVFDLLEHDICSS